MLQIIRFCKILYGKMMSWQRFLSVRVRELVNYF